MSRNTSSKDREQQPQPLTIKTKAVEFGNSDPEDNYLQLSCNQVKTGLLKELSASKKGITIARNYLVLTYLASHMDVEGKALVTQRKIADGTGLSRSAVGKAVKELSQIKIGGKPVITVLKLKGISNLESNLYHFNVEYIMQQRGKIETYGH